MQEVDNNKYPNDLNDEIDLQELFYLLLQGKWIIISVTALFSTIGVIYSLSLPNMYESKTLLAPVSSSSMSQSFQSYGSLASLAGISIPSGDGETQKAISRLGSLSFFENNIITNIFLPDLMAYKSWNFIINEAVYDEDIYDKESNTWVRDYSYPSKKIPSNQESFRVFKNRHFNLSEDQKNGFVTISISHQSPFIAKNWVEILVTEINNYHKSKDKLASEKAIDYLNEQILKTNLSEIKMVIAELLKKETQTLALIEANQYYVYEYIDRPSVPELKSAPDRALISILAALFGGMLSIFFVSIRHYTFLKKTS